MTTPTSTATSDNIPPPAANKRRRRERFPDAMLAAFKAAGRGTKLIVAAGFAILLIYTLTGIPIALLVFITVALYFASRRSGTVADFMPSDDEMARADREHAEQDHQEWEASGEGQRTYQQVLLELSALQGQDITVDLDDFGRVSGILGPGVNIATDPGSDEILLFHVGTAGNGFLVDRDRYTAPGAVVRRGDHGALELRGADGQSLTIWVHALAGEV